MINIIKKDILDIISLPYNWDDYNSSKYENGFISTIYDFTTYFIEKTSHIHIIDNIRILPVPGGDISISIFINRTKHDNIKTHIHIHFYDCDDISFHICESYTNSRIILKKFLYKEVHDIKKLYNVVEEGITYYLNY